MFQLCNPSLWWWVALTLVSFLLNPLSTSSCFLLLRSFPRSNHLLRQRSGRLNLHPPGDGEWLRLLQLCRCAEVLLRKRGLGWQLSHFVFRIQVSEHRNPKSYLQLSQMSEYAPKQSIRARRGTHGTSRLAQWALQYHLPLVPLSWPGSPHRMLFEVALWHKTRARHLWLAAVFAPCILAATQSATKKESAAYIDTSLRTIGQPWRYSSLQSPSSWPHSCRHFGSSECTAWTSSSIEVNMPNSFVSHLQRRSPSSRCSSWHRILAAVLPLITSHSSSIYLRAYLKTWPQMDLSLHDTIPWTGEL